MGSDYWLVLQTPRKNFLRAELEERQEKFREAAESSCRV